MTCSALQHGRLQWFPTMRDLILMWAFSLALFSKFDPQPIFYGWKQMYMYRCYAVYGWWHIVRIVFPPTWDRNTTWARLSPDAVRQIGSHSDCIALEPQINKCCFLYLYNVSGTDTILIPGVNGVLLPPKIHGVFATYPQDIGCCMLAAVWKELFVWGTSLDSGLRGAHCRGQMEKYARQIEHKFYCCG